MKLAMSNIAWPPEQASNAYALMARHGVFGLEIAPSLLFPDQDDPFAPEAAACRTALEQIGSAGLELVSMQSLLFGVDGAFLFGSPTERETFVRSINRAIDLASRLSIPNLVIGSPKNRKIPEQMDTDRAWAEALDVFHTLGEIAKASGTVLAMEPNPVRYGTNFLTNFPETLRFCSDLSHPAVRANFDTGALHVNDEFLQARHYFTIGKLSIAHIHVSEPDLAPVHECSRHILDLFKIVSNSEYDKWVSVEMLAPSEHGLDTVNRTLSTCARLRDSLERSKVAV